MIVPAPSPMPPSPALPPRTSVGRCLVTGGGSIPGASELIILAFSAVSRGAVGAGAGAGAAGDELGLLLAVRALHGSSPAFEGAAGEAAAASRAAAAGGAAGRIAGSGARAEVEAAWGEEVLLGAGGARSTLSSAAAGEAC